MVILKIFCLFIWLLAVPFCMGLIFMPLFGRRLRTPGAVFVAGYILLFTVLELTGIPVVLLSVYHGFTTFMKWFTPLTLLCGFVGIGIALKEKKRGYGLNGGILEDFRGASLEGKAMLALFLILVGFQLYMSFTRASFDGDDAYYGVQALIAQQIDTLYRINPYTGRSSPLDVRHALALFPIWEAYVGSMSGIHATIICHSVVPLVLIPLTYVLYYQIGRRLFGKKKEMLPMFMALIALWQLFGNVSIYTTETFFLTRTWQGKSFAGNFVIPAVIWIFLCLFPEGGQPPRKESPSDGEDCGKGKAIGTGPWVLLTCLNLAGGASSSLAIFLSCMMTAGLAALYAIRDWKLSILIKAGLTCIPGGAYVLLYLALTHGILIP